MDKIFSVKIQEIRSPEKAPGDYVSLPFSFDPNDKLMEEQRGKLFAVLDISGKGVPQSNLTSGAKLIFDVLKETYFGELEGTPLQALEKAFHTAKENVLKMPLDSGNISPHPLDINLVTAVLWGKVLYIAQFGTCAAYIIKETSALNIGKSSEGEVVVSSGIVEKGDVLVLGSGGFKELFTLEELPLNLSKLSDEKFLENCKKLSAIIVKFDVLNFWGGGDSIKFATPAKSTAKAIMARLFAREPRIKIPVSSFETRSKKRFALLGVSAVLLILFLTFSITLSRKQKIVSEMETSSKNVVQELYGKMESAKNLVNEDKDKAKEMLMEISAANPDNLSSQDKEELNKVLGSAASLLDEIEGVLPIEETREIYDFSKESAADISGMVYLDNLLYVWSKDSNAGFKLDISGDAPILSELTPDGNIHFADIYDNKFYVVGDSDMQISSKEGASFVKQDVTGKASFSKALAFKIYYGNGYILTSEGIIKLREEENGYSADNWLKVPISLEEAEDFAIDGNLYVLFKNGDIKKLYMGEEDTAFMVKNVPSNLKEPRFIYTNIDMNDIYILDTLDRSIVVIDKMGSFQKKYRMKDSNINTADIRGFAVKSSLESAFILTNSKIFELAL